MGIPLGAPTGPGALTLPVKALVLESALQRRLADGALDLSYSQVRRDLDRLRAVLLEVEGQHYLLRTQLQGEAHAAFQAAGVRPPAHLQTLD